MSFTAPITGYTSGWKNTDNQAQLVDKVMKAIKEITVEDIMARYPEKNRAFCIDVKEEIDLFIGHRDFKLDPILRIEQFPAECSMDVNDCPGHHASRYLKDLLNIQKN